MRKSGTVGKDHGDGWVAWTTVDDSFSYNPTIAFGEYLIFIGRGVDWGAEDDNSAVLHIIDLRTETECPIDGGIERHIDSWTRGALRDACCGLAARYEAPNLNWIREAVDQLWEALHA